MWRALPGGGGSRLFHATSSVIWQHAVAETKVRRASCRFMMVRYFLALAETLNFHTSSRPLPRVSAGIDARHQEPEAKLGAGPLIHRDPGRTQLTELGITMLPFFRQMQSELEAAKAVAQDYIRLSGARLRIGLMCTIGPRTSSICSPSSGGARRRRYQPGGTARLRASRPSSRMANLMSPSMRSQRRHRRSLSRGPVVPGTLSGCRWAARPVGEEERHRNSRSA